ncbi:cell wall hydrolase [Aquibacillus saliphilus]|uniref:cell wall hydrolase n=1 Tax=Aquibacillus saliphilus TaxID=1909422 RepID=UPI001CF06A62|nr:cell wall hydrolase [Aquibacillus saliphilus]
MNKFKNILLTASLSISFLIAPTVADAATYQLQKNDSFWTIANKYGVSLLNLQSTNNRSSSLLYAGETLSIPTTMSSADRDLMARLVHAEAKGESYAGKVAVATVILNRMDNKQFPNTVNGVVYQRSAGGHYAFSPVKDGAINQVANTTAKRAVNEALAFRGQGAGSLYFYNPKTAKSSWITTREVTITIGNHVFAR